MDDQRDHAEEAANAALIAEPDGPRIRRLPARPLANGLPAEPVVETENLTYCCGRCGAIVGNAELHAVWHLTVGHALDDIDALVVAVHGDDPVLADQTGPLDDRPGFSPADEEGPADAPTMTTDPSMPRARPRA